MSNLLRFLNNCPSHQNVAVLGSKYWRNVYTNTKFSKPAKLPSPVSSGGGRNRSLSAGVEQIVYPCNNNDSTTNEYLMAAGLQPEKMPKHVAIILDGSRRWLKAHGKPLTYEPFFQSNLLFADLCLNWGVATATTFIYSFRNLQRGKEANDVLFGQLMVFLEENLKEFSRKGIRVSVIGERSVLPEALKDKVEQVEEATRDCTKLELMLAVCYAGTRDIVQATRSICEKVKNGVIEVEAIDEGLFEQELWTKTSRAPAIDLLIRTSGRLRVSDYLMWQLAQAELYFTNVCAPEFGEVEFLEALRSFQERERTFGK